jgi:hypothetical protein
MSLDDFCQAFRSRWQACTEYFWPEGPALRAQAAGARLAEDLRRRYQRLLRRRRRIAQLRARLEGQERDITRVTGRVQACVSRADGANAWDAALTLDRLRRAAERTRARLRHHEGAYERQRLDFERGKQWARSLLVSAPPGNR